MAARPADLLAAFNAARDNARAFTAGLAANPRDFGWTHPILGSFDGYQWLLFAALHSERHAAQIDELKTHPDFPPGV